MGEKPGDLIPRLHGFNAFEKAFAFVFERDGEASFSGLIPAFQAFELRYCILKMRAAAQTVPELFKP
jgi:hypothetical protein